MFVKIQKASNYTMDVKKYPSYDILSPLNPAATAIALRPFDPGLPAEEFRSTSQLLGPRRDNDESKSNTEYSSNSALTVITIPHRLRFAAIPREA